MSIHKYWQVFVHENDPSTNYQEGKFLSFRVDDFSEVLHLKNEWTVEGMFVEYYQNSEASLMGSE